MLSFTTRNTGLVITVSTQLFTAWIFSVLLQYCNPTHIFAAKNPKNNTKLMFIVG